MTTDANNKRKVPKLLCFRGASSTVISVAGLETSEVYIVATELAQVKVRQIVWRVGFSAKARERGQ